MSPTEITIKLSDIAGQPDRELIDETAPSGDTDLGQIVERIQSRLYIVDGFHRTAGQVRYCRDNEIDPKDYMISVVLACEDDDDNDLVSDAATPGPKQEAAIAEIYRLAGRMPA
jgi:hypothetical protein